MTTCKQCQQEFTISKKDQDFFAKMAVPYPKLCPSCRQQRRQAWRNERCLYSRKCDLCKKPIISIYSPDKPFTVYCSDCWWSDQWDSQTYAQEIDWSRPFFKQFQELQNKVPRLTLYGNKNENSDYTNHSEQIKNCYLCVDVAFAENILYGQWVVRGQDCVDVYVSTSSELCYFCQYITNCYNCIYTYSAETCSNLMFCYDCKDTNDCFLSSNLRHAQYVFMNEQLSPEEYKKRMSRWDMGSFNNWQKAVAAYKKMVVEQTFHKYGLIYYSENSTGNVLHHANNCQQCFHVMDSEDNTYTYECLEIKDSMDAYESGFSCERQYETHGCNRSSYTKFCSVCYDNHFIEYCEWCHDSNDLFGCIGLRKQKYCILNKQYSEEKYKELKEKLITHMKEIGEYGEFFPSNLSPFGYNETVAPYYLPLTKDEAVAVGFRWHDGRTGSIGKTTKTWEQIPDNIQEVNAEIIKEALECTKCQKNYKVTKKEFEFYQRQKLPIPRLCPDCRYMARMSLRNPRKLWHRKCMNDGCKNEFETTYAPDRPETIYCEECYQKEI
ncbi:MAG: hypothetical protein A2233_03880 [Candidatus Kerfeldbacteria bacterium RIFOXYA2_FULL_38_24]|uniref:Probable zinc-binding domain-containing protein n=1 Tax=Candidatus Kerfeldbacteria bacterium RIFOXYB2_FULL_38_14 TaxID=1798547 RepID=A0A1G2BEU7_9BACT|nr:MAG: hypothetical protein A2233_03880 [Candidatus Kerfeldbacteria bacterium RIFOXYA2_FULL_38_24]OGY87206.1 MAG: hypothetical protein A2319_01000 [Candidatus Kerfeldbacteria bacterium RIFOXYB2_FULL_38_14]